MRTDIEILNDKGVFKYRRRINGAWLNWVDLPTDGMPRICAAQSSLIGINISATLPEFQEFIEGVIKKADSIANG